MKIFIVPAIAALFILSACDAPQSDENDDERTEQGDQEEDD